MNILVTVPEGKIKDTYFPQEVMKELKKHGNVIENELGKPFSSREIRDRIKGVDICVTHWLAPPFTKEVLQNADKLKMIAHAAGSVAGFVTDAVYEKDIKVCSANSIMAKYVAEGVITCMLSALRNITFYDSAMKGGKKWPQFHDRTLFGSRIGLIGLGMVGKYLLGLLEPFNTQVKIYDPYINEKSIEKYDFAMTGGIDEVMSWADIVSLHAARTPETIGMINRQRLELLKDGALFINTARAAIINEQDLLNELNKKRFFAVLDVYHKEPLPEDSPLRKMDNVMLLPHKAASPAREQMTYGIIEEIHRFMNNEPLKYEIPYEKYELMTR